MSFMSKYNIKKQKTYPNIDVNEKSCIVEFHKEQ